MPDKTISETAIGDVFNRPVDTSCNRSSLCRYSTDVLYNIKTLPHRYNFGVMKTSIEKVDGYTFQYNLQIDGKNQTVSIKFTLEHKPEECMYPHTEIKVYKDGVLLKNEVKPPSLRKAIRLKLAPLFDVCHRPDLNFTFPKETKWQVFSAKIKLLFKRVFRTT